MRASVRRGSARWTAARWWEELRANPIAEACAAGPTASGRSSPPVAAESLVRGEPEALERLDYLIGQTRGGPRADSPPERARLASLLDLRGEHEEALALLEGGAAAPPPSPAFSAAASLLREVVARHVAFAAERARRLAASERSSGASATVPVVDAEGLSRDTFAERYLRPGHPVVVRGAGLAPQWTPELLVTRLGSRRVPLRRCSAGSVQWAQLEFAGSSPFGEFAREHVLAKDAAGVRASPGAPQLFDFSVWQQCADALADDVAMPKWFGVDLYTHASAHVHPVSGSAAPTLFLAARGTGSGLHVDFLQTHFWMALCHGRKRWRIVPREDLACLYPRYLVDLNPSFPADLDGLACEAELAERPALASAGVLEVELEPGDVIFVPRGCPHQVSNLETAVAISANFIDRTNVEESTRDAELLGLVSEDPQHVAASLKSAVSTGLLDELEAAAPQHEHSSLRDFKARHGEARTPQETQRRLVLGAQALAVAGAALCLVGWLGSRRSRAAAPA